MQTSASSLVDCWSAGRTGLYSSEKIIEDAQVEFGMWVSAFCQAVDCMALTCACASHVFLCGCIFVGIDVYIACIKNCSMCGEIDSHGLSVCLTEASVTKTYSSHCFEWLNREGAFRVTHVSLRVEWVENET